MLKQNKWLVMINEAAQGLARRKIGLDDILVGVGATIDSLDLLGFLVRLEKNIFVRTGRFVAITSEHRLERILTEAESIKKLVVLLEAFDREQS